MDYRFLFFLYFFPPAPGTAPKRNFNISKAISTRVAKSVVFTAPYPNREIPQIPHMEIRPIPVFDYRRWLRSKTKDGYLSEHRKKQSWKQWGIRIINTYPINILAGEGGIIYFLNLLSKGQKEIRKQNITHIYSSYRPFADHYAAYFLKKRNPQICWIADFRDLIVDPNYDHILFPKMHHYFFKKIFKKADLLTTVSNGLAVHLKKYNPNVITLRNGITKIPVSIPPVHCKYFKIAYTGSMSLDKRNAEPVFKALVELISKNQIDRDEIRLVYAGKDGFYWEEMSERFSLSANLVNKGIVSSQEAAEIQKNACINLLLTVSSEQLQGVLTGKMIEYFEAGSPVLGIIVNQNDPEIDHLLSELELGNSFSDQPKDYFAIRDFILREYMHWKRTGMNRKPVNMDILKEKYSIEKTMEPLFEFLKVDQITNKEPESVIQRTR